MWYKKAQEDMDNSPDYTIESMRQIVHDWYLAEYKLQKAKEQHLDVDKYEKAYKKINRELADMILVACKNWMQKTNWMINELSDPECLNPVVDEEVALYIEAVAPIKQKIEHTIQILSKPDVNPVEVNFALNTVHFTGQTIFEHMPGMRRKEAQAFMEYLSDLSNTNKIPEETEGLHNLISIIYPQEEHSKEWLQKSASKHCS